MLIESHKRQRITLNTPGTNLKIHAPSCLIQKKADYALLLAWNFAKEIIAQQQEYLHTGGKFILPLPTAEIISSNEKIRETI